MKKYTGEFALLFNTLIWGGTFALIKNAYSDISPLLFLALRFTIAALIFLTICLFIIKKDEQANINCRINSRIFLFRRFYCPISWIKSYDSNKIRIYYRNICSFYSDLAANY